MKLKVLMALVEEDRTERIIDVARKEGATGCTVITSARGEGLVPPKTFFGLELEGQGIEARANGAAQRARRRSGCREHTANQTSPSTRGDAARVRCDGQGLGTLEGQHEGGGLTPVVRARPGDLEDH